MKSLNSIYLSRLDHLRFFAALIVVFHHFRGSVTLNKDSIFSIANFIKLWIIQGATGVTLFLVLSAFLFTLIARAGINRINYKLFVYNRVLRIFPLLILLVFVVISINRGESSPIDILRILTLQLNTGNSMTGWGHEVFPIGPIWTIAVEFQFYLLFPILMIFIRTSGIRYVFLLISLIIMVRFMIVSLNSYEIYYNLYHTILGRLDQFMIGILLGIFYINGAFKNISNTRAILVLIISVSLLTVMLAMNLNIKQKYFSSVFYFLLEAILWGGVIISYLCIKIPENKFSDTLGNLCAFFGGLSFSIYLLHLPIGIIVSQFLNLQEPVSIVNSILNTLIRLPFILGASILSYYAIERPFMALRVKYLSEK